MKRRVTILISLFSLAIFGVVGCGEKNVDSILKVEGGIIQWDQVDGARSYEVDIGNGGKTTYETSYDLTELLECAGEYTVTVRYHTVDGKTEDLGKTEVQTELLEEPAVHTQKIDKTTYFVWEQVEDADEYRYDAHDGKGYQVATADKDGLYKVPVTDATEQLITVVAQGSMKDGILYLPAKTMYTYKDGNMFDMALLSNYPVVYTAEGEIEEFLKVGSTMKKGIYDMEISLYVMDGNYLDMIDKAYKDIEPIRETNPERYSTLYDRILLESIQFRYLILSIYPTEYTEDVLIEKRKEFKYDFERLRLTSFGENRDINDLWSEWGIN